MKKSHLNYFMPPKIWIAFVIALFLCYPFGLKASILNSSDPSFIETVKENYSLVTPDINGIGNAESDTNELSKIIQKSIDIAELQKYYKIDKNSDTVQANIYYYHPVLIPLNLQVKKGNNNLLFKEITTSLESISEDFFLFNSVEINDNSAKIGYQYYYYEGTDQKVIMVMLELQKANDKWSVSDTKFNK